MHPDGKMTQQEKRTVRMGGLNDSVLRLKWPNGETTDCYCETATLTDSDYIIKIRGRYPSNNPMKSEFELSFKFIANVFH